MISFLSKKPKPIVFVGVSGGVDSSVSALILKKAGYRVVGVFIRTWQPDFITCTWREEKRDAIRVCASLEIPFLECNLEKEYRQNVAEYMVNEYKRGRTPNPDVMCNREVKFGGFLEFARSHGALYVATGHYAQNKKNKISNFFELKEGKDPNKDQSYFLWTLDQTKLAQILFPVGHLSKNLVRKLAKKYRLPTATKKDSQGVCFLGKLDMKEFLSEFIPQKEGVVLDTQGNQIGTHKGAWLYTLGERHGFTILHQNQNAKPAYVIEKNITDNTLTVSDEPFVFAQKEHKKTFKLESFSEIFPEALLNTKNLTARIRYRGQKLPCKITVEDADLVVTFKDALYDLASGQSVVFYSESLCLGGGVVA